MGVQCCGGGHPIWCDSLPTLPVDPAHVEGRGVVRVVHISPWPLVEAGSGGGLVRQSGAETCIKGDLPVAFHSLRGGLLLLGCEGHDGPRSVQ